MTDTLLSPSSLYDEDFYAWSQEQAALMREGRFEDLDLDHLIQEVEGLGDVVLSNLRREYRIIAENLLKLVCRPEGNWRMWAEKAISARAELQIWLEQNPSLQPQLDEIFLVAYQRARQSVAMGTGLPVTTLPEIPPFSRTEAESNTYQQAMHRITGVAAVTPQA